MKSSGLSKCLHNTLISAIQDDAPAYRRSRGPPLRLFAVCEAKCGRKRLHEFLFQPDLLSSICTVPWKTPGYGGSGIALPISEWIVVDSETVAGIARRGPGSAA